MARSVLFSRGRDEEYGGGRPTYGFAADRSRYWSDIDLTAAGWRSGVASDAALDSADRRPADFPGVIDLATLDGSDGFRFVGIDRQDYSGRTVSSAGDVNGDGFDDVLIGAPGSNKEAGASYVVFGTANGFGARFDLRTLDGSNGFRIDGVDKYDRSGESVSSAGDVNGDGFDDIIIGAYAAQPRGKFQAGESYVVFGKAGGFSSSVDLATLDGSDGFRLNGIDRLDYSGLSVSSAGDVNGDGFDDIIIGASGGDPNRERRAGESYVVFGKAGGFSAQLDLATLDGSNGFRLDGGDADDYSGSSVASAGDVNGDGFDDIVIGAYRTDADGVYDAGAAYVVFGKADGFSATLDLATLDGDNGFRLDGVDIFDLSGYSVASAGDVNGDGFDDILIGAYGAISGGDVEAGATYVVFGAKDGFTPVVDLATLDGSNGFRLDGIDAYDRSGYAVSSAGDVNGDGFDDILIGARNADPGGSGEAGESYVVFGKAGGFAATFDLGTLNGSNGFRIASAVPFDYSGQSVSSAGDVNGDGFDDIMIGVRGQGSYDSNAAEAYVIFGRAPTEAVRRAGSAAGQEIHGGDFGDTLSGRGGDDLLIGGGGDDRLFGGSGRDTLEGGADADLFVFTDSKGRDTVADFSSVEGDVIRIVSASADSFADLSIRSDGAGGSLVRWSGGSIALAGVAAASLDKSDFVFASPAAFVPDAQLEAPMGAADRQMWTWSADLASAVLSVDAQLV